MKNFMSLNKQQKIEIICTIILLGFFCSTAFHYYLGIYRNLGYPYNTFLFRPEDRWNDFLWTIKVSHAPYQSEHLSVYFPFAYIISQAFAFLKPNYALGIYQVLCIIIFFLICYRQLRLNGSISFPNLFIFSLLTFPFLITLDRANYEFIVFFSLYFFIYCFNRRSVVSGFFLGCAIAFKAFPAILAILYKEKKQMVAFGTAAIFSLTVSIISYALLPDGLINNIKLHLINLSTFSNIYYVGNEGLFFGNSLFGAFKYISYWVEKPLISNTAYYILVGTSLTVNIWYVVFIEKKFWKKIALLIFALNLFPQMSAAYKLLHVFLPLFLFFDDDSQENSLLSFFYTVLFGLLLIPKDYLRLQTLPEASVSIVIDPLIMVIISLTIMVSGLVSFIKLNLSRRLKCNSLLPEEK